MTLATLLACLLLALGVEAVLGYPQALYRTIGHPVTWIGALIAALDTTLNRESFAPAARRVLGVAALIIIIAVPAALAYALQSALMRLPYGFILVALAASTLLASRSLYDHAAAVAAALRNGGLAEGRASVSRIVGRDTASLDEPAVCRAAIESLAENASDGVVAPAFWFALLGLPGIAAYKAINTADSMIGHRTPRHEAFGWAAARFDDVVNLPASRLTGALFALAALALPGASPRNAFAAMARDAPRHRSPNAGWPEASLAGALGLKLSGPRSYGGTPVDDAFMGDGRRDATPADIARALLLATRAFLILGAIAAVGSSVSLKFDW